MNATATIQEQITEEELIALGFTCIDLDDDVLYDLVGSFGRVYNIDFPHLNRSICTGLIGVKPLIFTLSDSEGNIIHYLNPASIISGVRTARLANARIKRSIEIAQNELKKGKEK